MVKNTEKKDLKIGCRANDLEKTEKRNGFNNLFDTEWEVFVIKKDKITGEYVGKTACCALSPVQFIDRVEIDLKNLSLNQFELAKINYELHC